MNRVVRIVTALLFTVVFTIAITSCSNDTEDRVVSNATMSSTSVNGSSKNCAVVLRAQQGTSYSIRVETEGSWAHFSNGETAVEGTMESTDRVVYIYLEQNNTGQSRYAAVYVRFGDGSSFDIGFEHTSYDSTIAFEREWAELPLCKSDKEYIFNTHYGKLGVKSDARNYTYCFDPEVRASIWVAYPLHQAYMTGSGNRNESSFGYDPEVSTSYQANLTRSYNGWYDRGHQLPAADRKCSQQMMDQTFYATNMTPQQYSFNQNKWGVLEGRVRNMVCADTLYVVTGAWFEGEHDSSIDNSTTDRSGNVCPTPTHYFKALLRTKRGNTGLKISEITDAVQLRAIAFWFKHANTGENTEIKSSDCISIAELEKRTGFTFFPAIDDSIEAEVKATAVPSEWGII